MEYESFEAQLRDERAQQSELDCLNYIAQKNVIDLLKTVPSQFDVSYNNYNKRLYRVNTHLPKLDCVCLARHRECLTKHGKTILFSPLSKYSRLLEFNNIIICYLVVKTLIQYLLAIIYSSKCLASTVHVGVRSNLTNTFYVYELRK